MFGTRVIPPRQPVRPRPSEAQSPQIRVRGSREERRDQARHRGVGEGDRGGLGDVDGGVRLFAGGRGGDQRDQAGASLEPRLLEVPADDAGALYDVAAAPQRAGAYDEMAVGEPVARAARSGRWRARRRPGSGSASAAPPTQARGWRSRATSATTGQHQRSRAGRGSTAVVAPPDRAAPAAGRSGSACSSTCAPGLVDDRARAREAPAGCGRTRSSRRPVTIA